MKKLHIVLVSAFLILGCSKNDDTVVLPPDLSVTQILSASYFQKGKSPLPEVQWNGDQGKFGLENTVQGLSIDTVTGQLYWDSSLPVGVHTVTLFAYNTAGKDQVAVTINNQFQGTFRGTRQSNTFFVNVLFDVMEIVFKADGTFEGYRQAELEGGELLDPSLFGGSYTLTENNMVGTIQFEDGESIPFEALLGQQGKLTGSFTLGNFFGQTTTFELNVLIEP